MDGLENRPTGSVSHAQNASASRGVTCVTGSFGAGFQPGVR